MRFPIKITENFLLEAMLAPLGVKPETSFVEISDGTLEIQMGRWFHEKLPIAGISQVAPSEWPWWGGLGVKLHHHGVGVVAAYENVVNIQWKTPQPMRVLIEIPATQLWVSVEDRDGFLKALADAAGIPVSEHAPF